MRYDIPKDNMMRLRYILSEKGSRYEFYQSIYV